MAVFYYSAADQGGKTNKGEKEAENEKALAQSLKEEGLFLLEARKKDESGLGSRLMKFRLETVFAFLRPIRLTDKMFFTRNLAVMIGAGLSLNKALDALSREANNTRFRKVLNDVNSSVARGKSFADSLRFYPGVFNELFVNMIEVGETSGKLTMILKLLANQMKKDYELKKRVKGAMFYPVIILSVLAAVGTLMMIYVVPSLSQTIKELGVELPLSTRIVIAVSDFMTKYYLVFLAGFVSAAAILFRILKTKTGKEIFDRAVLRVPVFGNLVKEFNAARFCRTLSYLITSGVSMVRSLEITSTVLGNSLFKRAASAAAAEIQKGRQLNEILKEHEAIFQPMVVQMIKVGEETGKISDMMLRLAIFFEEDVSNTTKNLSTIIEPVLMIFIGAAVGFFAVSMLQPIYGSLGSIGG